MYVGLRFAGLLAIDRAAEYVFITDHALQKPMPSVPPTALDVIHIRVGNGHCFPPLGCGGALYTRGEAPCGVTLPSLARLPILMNMIMVIASREQVELHSEDRYLAARVPYAVQTGLGSVAASDPERS